MASQGREQQRDEELEKILTKAFEDIRKRVYAHVAKREKKLVKDLKLVSKAPSKKPVEERKKRSSHDYHRSQSSDSVESK